MPPYVHHPTVSEDMFTLLKHEWVWDFFFASGDTELDMLQYAFERDTLVTMEVDLSTVEHMETYSSLFNISEKNNILFLPSFTTGAISVGFAVSNVQRSNKTIISRETYMGRIARDDDNGNCLFISEQFNDNVTEVSYFSMLNSSCRETRFNLFQKDPFRRAVERLRTTTFQEQPFNDALILSFHCFDARPCPVCAAPRAANCDCKLQIERKRHPRDDEREMRNLVSYTGGFQGLACVQVFDKGRRLFQGNFLSTANIRHTVDGESQRKLGLWAIRQAATSRPVNPLALMMSSCGTRNISTSDTLLLASLADSMSDSTDPSDSPSDRLANSHAGRIIAAALTVAASPSGSSSHPRLLHPAQPAPVLPTAEPEKLVALVEGAPVVAPPDIVDEKGTGSEASPPHTASSALSDMRADVSAHVGESAVQTAAEGNTEVETPAEAPVETLVQRPVVLAPAIKPVLAASITALPVAPVGAAETEDAELAMRRRRVELRRERNRESAQRSNLKRKLRMQKLKDEIAEMSGREMYLRAREKILREENVSLRMTLSR